MSRERSRRRSVRSATARRGALLAGALVLLAILGLDLSIQTKGQHWDPDGLIFARMMLVDRGMSPAQADRTASPFYRRGAEAAYGNAYFTPSRPAWLELQVRAYRGRVVLPYLASFLYPWFGFWSFVVISGIAYVVAVLGMYALLLRFAAPVPAALAALLFACADPIRGLASVGAADELMIALGVIVLIAAIAALSGPGSTAWLFVFLVASAGMTFTRSWLHLPLGAALGALCFAYARHREQLRVAWRLAAAVGAIAVAYALGMLTGRLPGPIEYLRWLDVFQHGGHTSPSVPAFFAWYTSSLAKAVALETAHWLTAGTMALAVLCAIGLFVRRRDVAIGPVVGVGVAAWLTFLIHPIPYLLDISDVFETPLFPVITVGLTITAIAALRSGGRRFAKIPNSDLRPASDAVLRRVPVMHAEVAPRT